MKHRKSTENHPAGIYAPADRCKPMMLLFMAAICVGLAVSACDFRKVDATAETNSKKESNMESIQAATPIRYKIPPIDAAAATQIETATFALG